MARYKLYLFKREVFSAAKNEKKVAILLFIAVMKYQRDSFNADVNLLYLYKKV